MCKFQRHLWFIGCAVSIILVYPHRINPGFRNERTDWSWWLNSTLWSKQPTPFISCIPPVHRKRSGAGVSWGSAIPPRLAQCGVLAPVVRYELVHSRRLTDQFGFSFGWAPFPPQWHLQVFFLPSGEDVNQPIWQIPPYSPWLIYRVCPNRFRVEAKRSCASYETKAQIRE